MDFFQIFALIVLILIFCYYGFVFLKKIGIFPLKKMNNIQYCKFCGKEIIKPNVCEYCHQKFCREHQHPFHHKCKESSDNYSLHENCSFLGCGKREYLPHRCPYCQKFFCDEHYHTFDHNCEEKEKEGDRPSNPGVVTVSKNGKIFVK
jgi:predicted nucleic acid binding AN1-type Zn finger protein